MNGGVSSRQNRSKRIKRYGNTQYGTRNTISSSTCTYHPIHITNARQWTSYAPQWPRAEQYRLVRLPSQTRTGYAAMASAIASASAAAMASASASAIASASAAAMASA